jgi:hypothetical protein
MNGLITWVATWRERRAMLKRHKSAMAGFEYALGVLREETDPELHRQLQEQADSDPESPFCFGMSLAIKGWKT